ncbi:MAG: hypothetical protein ACRDRT_12625, partial [Pseudonocardiaceae bacterium]
MVAATAMAMVVVVIGWTFGHPIFGLVGGLVAGATLVMLSLVRAVSTLTRSLKAEPADASRHARALNLADNLCVAGGLVMPRVLVVEASSANSMVVGVSRRRCALVLTSGLLETLTRVELEGILARQLSSIRSGDAVLATVATVLVGRPMGCLARLVGSRMVVWGDRLVALIVGSDRDIRIDFSGVALTRYPPGLAAALEKIAVASRVGRSRPGTSALWCASPAARTSGETPLLWP